MARFKEKKRFYKVLFLFIITFLYLAFKMIKFQVIDSQKLAAMTNNQYSYREILRENQFVLFDCNGKDLFKYKDKYYAVIVPEQFKENNSSLEEKVLFIMYCLKNYNKNYDLVSKYNKPGNSSKFYYEIDKYTYNKLKKIKNIKGFYVYKTSKIDKDYNGKKEFWKIENILLNPYKNDGKTFKDKNSLEMNIHNKTKHNKKNYIAFKKDLDGKIISTQIEKPTKNLNPKLTLDLDIERKIRSILNNKDYKRFNQIGVILMESNTGKIKAMLQKDETMPNVNIGAATENGFPPGSIFKILVQEAALQNNKVNVNSIFTCTKEFEERHKTNHGTISMQQAFIVSCNDIFSQIGRKTGFENINSLAKSHRLYDKILDLEDEQKGKVEKINGKDPNISDGTLSLFSFGQMLRITPIEAIGLANTVANNGVFVKPYLLDGYTDDEFNDIETFKSQKEKIIQEDISNKLKKEMLNVVKQGTGRLAYNPKILIGGKTGTTERKEKVGKNKFENISDGWFVGFFKSHEKYYSMIVLVPNISSTHDSAGTTAVPIFYDIVKQIKEIL